MHGASTGLRCHLELVLRCLARYTARHGHRMLQADGRLSDLYVSIGEVRTLLGAPREDAAPDPMSERAELPSAEEAERAVVEYLPALVAAEAGSPIEDLRVLFGLTDAEIRLLVAAAAPHLSIDVARLFTFAWADFAVKRPTVGFLAELVADAPDSVYDLVGALRTDGALQRHRLVTVEESLVWGQDAPVLHRTVTVPDAVVALLMGHPRPLPAWMELSGYGAGRGAAPSAVEDLVVRDRTAQDLGAFVSQAVEAPDRAPRLLLVGARGVGRRTLLTAWLARAGRGVLTVALSRLAGEPHRFEDRLAEAAREALLRRCLLLVRGDGVIEDTDRLAEVADALQRVLDPHPGPCALTARRPAARLHGLLDRLLEVVVPSPSSAQQRELWRRALAVAGVNDPALPEQLVLRFDLTPGGIHEATEDARARSVLLAGGAEAASVTLEDVAQAVRRRADHALSEVADPFTTTLTWDDVVLPEHTVGRLREIVSHARHREQVLDGWGFRRKLSYGQGLSCLFAGPPGTGKTMMAGVLAQQLGREIYRVDVSRITSKWVGETEKNLARLFDEAEEAQVILLFDEADSLFSTRTDVKSSNDRFANMEVNYLLQRMEQYDGMTVLTTNFEQSIDEAFKRRIRFWVSFPFPDEELRARLWQSMLPEEAAVEDEIDFEELGREFNLAGGSIKNAVLRAAFYAAEARGAITMDRLWDAATAELRDIGKLVREE